MAQPAAPFRFLDPGLLVDGELTLHLAKTVDRDPAQQFVSTYHFEMQVGGQIAGGIRFRAENDYDVETFAGNLGYNVAPEFRGHHFAERACRLLLPLARAHGFTQLWITCDPDNLASRRTCERLGAELVETVALPADSDMYQDGERSKCRYRLSLGPLTAQPVLDAFYDAVVACGRKPPFKPSLVIASTPYAMRYDPLARAVVLVPYEVLPAPRRAAMDRFAAVGTLGLSGPRQYAEVFHHLLVAHELGHWLQEIAQRPLTRWQAEYQANQIMVAFWREFPAPPPAAPTERRLANFVAQSPGMPNPMPADTSLSAEAYFTAHLAEIEGSPVAYAGFQKLMVRQAMAEQPAPRFCQMVETLWPQSQVIAGNQPPDDLDPSPAAGGS